MKLILALLAYFFTIAVMAQEKPADSLKAKSSNFLDMQTNVLTSVFGENLDGNANGKTIGYLELLEKSNLPEEQKTEYKNLYYLQSKTLTQKQKDSLGKVIEQKIIEAKRIDD